VRIASVYRRPRRDVFPVDSEEIFLRRGLGIDGDCHASPVSPRQLLIVSTGAYDYCNLPPTSLRENILVRAANLKLSSGSLLRLGSNAAVRITFECEPCGRLNKFHPKLSKDIVGKRGYLARVIRSGVVKPGDRVQVEPDVFHPFSDNWRERIISVVHKLPGDCFISYSQLAELAGVPKVFCRAFPRVLRSQPDLPWERVVPSHELRTDGNAPPPLCWAGDVIFQE
jgi:hypothetical protein